MNLLRAPFYLWLCVGVLSVVTTLQLAYAQESALQEESQPISQESIEAVMAEEEVVQPVLDSVMSEEVVTEEVMQTPQDDVVEESAPLPETVLPENVDGLVIENDTVVDSGALQTLELSQTTKEQTEILVEEIALVSELNEELPFALLSTTSFAINEVPEFSFVLSEEESSFSEIFSQAETLIVETYEGSIVEQIVDVVRDTFEAVVEAVLPQADAETSDVDVVQPVEEVSVFETVAPTPETDQGPIREDSSSTVVPEEIEKEEDFQDVATATLSAATTTPIVASTENLLPPFAIVDGMPVPVSVSYHDNGFVVRLESQAFGVGTHALSLHLVHEEILYVFNTTFSIEGIVLSQLPLVGNQVAEVIQGSDFVSAVWLVSHASGSPYSYEKIHSFVPEELIPTLSFEENTVLWNAPDGAVLLGFDINAKMVFSQTLSIGPKEKNILELDEGSFLITTPQDGVDLSRISEQKTP